MGVDTAAVVGFEADALPQGPVDAGNPYAVENRMKAAGTPDPQAPEDAEVSALAMAENEMAVEESETGAAAENAAKDLQASEETVKSPLETGSAVSEAQKNEKSAAEYTLSDFKERLETARTEAEKYQDDPSMSQTSRYAGGGVCAESLGPGAEYNLRRDPQSDGRECGGIAPARGGGVDQKEGSCGR